MKKVSLALASLVGCAALVVLCSCAYVPNNNFSAPCQAAIYSQTTHSNYIGEKITDPSKVTIIKDVKGSSTAINVLFFLALGDCSATAAKKDALENVQSADDVLNMEVSTRVINVLFLFQAITTKVEGKAISYGAAK